MRAMQLSDIQTVALILVVSGFILGVGVIILQDFKTATAYIECDDGYWGADGICCLSGYTVNASDSTRCLNDTWPTDSNVSTAAGTASSPVNDTVDDGIGSLGELSSWLETIALVIAAVIIIGLVLLFRRNRL